MSKEGQHGMADGGGADVILATSNSYKATSDSIKGLRADTNTISPEILFRRARIIGSTQNDRQHLYEALDM